MAAKSSPKRKQAVANAKANPKGVVTAEMTLHRFDANGKRIRSRSSECSWTVKLESQGDPPAAAHRQGPLANRSDDLSKQAQAQVGSRQPCNPNKMMESPIIDNIRVGSTAFLDRSASVT